MSHLVVGVFTSSRADLGPLGPVLTAIQEHPALDLRVLVTGTHLERNFGGEITRLEADFPDRVRAIPVSITTSEASDLAKSFGAIAMGMSAILEQDRLDVLVLLGDRWELLAAAGVALLHDIPIAHLHGGEVTEGAIDERIRHSITKLADLHLCATTEAARRIRRLGEQVHRIVVTGAPGVDRAARAKGMSEAQLESLLGSPVVRPLAVIVHHPPTVERHGVRDEARAVFECASRLGSCVVLYPGVDPGSSVVIEELHAAAERHSNIVVRRNLGDDYLPLLASADVLLGNSSSGIIESASLGLPVVNVGPRQHGRLRPANVIDVENVHSLDAALDRALSPDFRKLARRVTNPYGSGNAGPLVAEAVARADFPALRRKHLVESPDQFDTLESLSIPGTASLRDAVAAIDAGARGIALVVGAEGHLVGTVSDGDVRRALLAGADLGSSVSSIVNELPIVASVNDSVEVVLQMMQRHSVGQVPVLDDGGTLVGLHGVRELIGVVMDRGLGDE